MMRKVIPVFLCLAVLVTTFQGCAPEKVTTAASTALDPDFAGYKGVLLILRNFDNKNGYNQVDKTVIKGFDKYYRGKYKMISSKDLQDYPDLDEYRYLVVPGLEVSGYGNTRLTQSRYSLQNRKTGQTFLTKLYPGYSGLQDLPMAFEYLRTSK